jgi:hypothetical protein
MEHSENCTCQCGWVCPSCFEKLEDENSKLKKELKSSKGYQIKETILTDEKTGDRTIVSLGASVKISRDDFRKLLTPNKYKIKFEKIESNSGLEK